MDTAGNVPIGQKAPEPNTVVVDGAGDKASNNVVKCAAKDIMSASGVVGVASTESSLAPINNTAEEESNVAAAAKSNSKTTFSDCLKQFSAKINVPNVGFSSRNMEDGSRQDDEVQIMSVATASPSANDPNKTGKKETLSCTFCPYWCEVENRMILHLFEHRNFTNTLAISEQKGFLFEGDQYLCHSCVFKSSSRLMFREHIRCHTIVSPYSCGECNIFIDLKLIREHFRVEHSHSRPYIHVMPCIDVDSIMQKLGSTAPHSVTEVHIPLTESNLAPVASEPTSQRDQPDKRRSTGADSVKTPSEPCQKRVKETNAQVLQRLVSQCHYRDGEFVCGVCRFRTPDGSWIRKHILSDIERLKCCCANCNRGKRHECAVLTGAVSKLLEGVLNSGDTIQIADITSGPDVASCTTPKPLEGIMTSGDSVQLADIPTGTVRSNVASYKAPEPGLNQKDVATFKAVPATIKSVPATTKAVPATIKAVPATTKAVHATIKAVPATIKAVPATTKAVPATIKAAHATIDTVPATNKAVPATIKALPATIKAVPSTTKAVPATIKAVPATTKSVHATIKAVPATIKAVPATTKAVPATIKAAHATIEAVPATNKAVPATIKAVPATTTAVPATIEAVPATIVPALRHLDKTTSAATLPGKIVFSETNNVASAPTTVGAPLFDEAKKRKLSKDNASNRGLVETSSKKHKTGSENEPVTKEAGLTRPTKTKASSKSCHRPKMRKQIVRLLVDFCGNRYVCKCCRIEERDEDLFRKHIWQDVHPNGQCSHTGSTHGPGMDNADGCPHINNLMQTLFLKKQASNGKGNWQQIVAAKIAAGVLFTVAGSRTEDMTTTGKYGRDHAVPAKAATTRTTERTVGTDEATTRTTERTVGTDQATTGTTERTVGTDLVTTGTTERTVGTDQAATGTTERTVGTDLVTTGTTERTVGTDQAATGTTERTVGTDLITTGTTERTVGTDQATTGTTERTVGTDQATTGTTERTVGTDLITTGTTERTVVTDLVTTGTTERTVGTDLVTTGTTERTVVTDLVTTGIAERTVGTDLAPTGTRKSTTAEDQTASGTAKRPEKDHAMQRAGAENHTTPGTAEVSSAEDHAMTSPVCRITAEDLATTGAASSSAADDNTMTGTAHTTAAEGHTANEQNTTGSHPATGHSKLMRAAARAAMSKFHENTKTNGEGENGEPDDSSDEDYSCGEASGGDTNVVDESNEESSDESSADDSTSSDEDYALDKSSGSNDTSDEDDNASESSSPEGSPKSGKRLRSAAFTSKQLSKAGKSSDNTGISEEDDNVSESSVPEEPSKSGKTLRLTASTSKQLSKVATLEPTDRRESYLASEVVCSSADDSSGNRVTDVTSATGDLDGSTYPAAAETNDKENHDTATPTFSRKSSTSATSESSKNSAATGTSEEAPTTEQSDMKKGASARTIVEGASNSSKSNPDVDKGTLARSECKGYTDSATSRVIAEQPDHSVPDISNTSVADSPASQEDNASVMQSSNALKQTPSYDSTPKQTATQANVPKPTASQGNTPKQTTLSGNAPKKTASQCNAPKPTASQGSAPKPTASQGDTPKQTTLSGNAPKKTASQYNAPKPTASQGNAPKQTTLSDNAPKKTASQGNAPNQTASRGNAPNQTTSSGNAPKQTTSSDNDPKPTASQGSSPKPTASQGNAPKQTTLSGNASKKTASHGNGPKPIASQGNAAKPTTSSDNAPKQTASSDNAPKQTTLSGNAPKPTASQGNATKPTISSDNASKQTTSSGNAPKQTTSSGNAPKQTALSGNAPMQTASQGNASKPTVSQSNAPKQTTSSGNTPKQTASSGNAPKQTTSSGNAPKQTALSGNAPMQTASQGNASKPTVSQGNASKQTVSSGNAPKQITSSGNAPKQTALSGNAPMQTASQGNASKPTVSQGNAVKQTASSGNAPKQTTSSGNTPKQTASSDNASKQTTSSCDAPKETTSSSNAPKETALSGNHPKQTAASGNDPKQTAAYCNAPKQTASQGNAPKQIASSGNSSDGIAGSGTSGQTNISNKQSSGPTSLQLAARPRRGRPPKCLDNEAISVKNAVLRQTKSILKGNPNPQSIDHNKTSAKTTGLVMKSKEKSVTPQKRGEKDDSDAESDAEEEGDFFKCRLPTCGQSFPDVAGLRKHIEKSHRSTKLFPCPYCSCLWSNYNRLIEHIPSHVGLKPYRCVQCGVSYKTDASLRKHFRKSHHVNKNFTCTVEDCEFVTNLWTEFKVHVFSYHSEEKGWTCFACDARFPKRDDYFVHVESGMESVICCGLCTLKAKMRHTITRHSDSVHNGATNPIFVETTVKCVQTVKRTEPTGTPTKLSVVTPTKSVVLHECSHCDYADRNKASFNKHVEAHGVQKKLELAFSCELCTFGSSDSTQYKVHLANHRKTLVHQLRCFKCTHCTFATNQMKMIEKHLQEMHKERPFKFEVQQEIVKANRQTKSTDSGVQQIDSRATPELSEKLQESGKTTKIKSSSNAAKKTASSSNASKQTASSGNAAKKTASSDNAAKQTGSSGNAPKQTATSVKPPKLTVSSGNASKQNAPSSNAEKQTASAGNDPKQTASTGNASKQTAPSSNAEKQTASAGNDPKQTASTGNAAKQVASSGNAPKQTASAGNATMQTASSLKALKLTASSGDAPKQSTLSGNAPKQTASSSNAPKQTALSGKAPQQTASAGNATKQTASSVKALKLTASFDTTREKELVSSPVPNTKQANAKRRGKTSRLCSDDDDNDDCPVEKKSKIVRKPELKTAASTDTRQRMSRGTRTASIDSIVCLSSEADETGDDEAPPTPATSAVESSIAAVDHFHCEQDSCQFSCADWQVFHDHVQSLHGNCTQWSNIGLTVTSNADAVSGKEQSSSIADVVSSKDRSTSNADALNDKDEPMNGDETASTADGNTNSILDSDTVDAKPASVQEEQTYHCDLCSTVCEEFESFKMHMEALHSFQVVRTDDAFSDQNIMAIPIESPPESTEASGSGPLQCKNCPFTSKSKDKMAAHNLKHSSKLKTGFKCMYCSYSALQRFVVTRHALQYHPDRPKGKGQSHVVALQSRKMPTICLKAAKSPSKTSPRSARSVGQTCGTSDVADQEGSGGDQEEEIKVRPLMPCQGWVKLILKLCTVCNLNVCIFLHLKKT